MTKPFERRPLKVCLLSSHAFFLSEMQRSIRTQRLQLQTRQLKACVARPGAPVMVLPRASIYVVDAQRWTDTAVSIAAYIRQHRPKAQIVVLAERWTEENAFPLLREGVKGLLNYSQAKRQMDRALEAVVSGGYWVAQSLLCRFVDSILACKIAEISPRLPSIRDNVSPREQQILKAVLQNRSNKEIAAQFNISERTVKFHVSNLLAKSGVQRRADLILMSLREENLLLSGVQ